MLLLKSQTVSELVSRNFPEVKVKSCWNISNLMQSVLEMFSFILIMNYASSAVCLSLRGIQSFPVKNGLSMYNKDLQILHALMKDDN